MREKLEVLGPQYEHSILEAGKDKQWNIMKTFQDITGVIALFFWNISRNADNCDLIINSPMFDVLFGVLAKF